MVEANPLWGAPRIHGELLKLGIEISERTVSNLMPCRKTKPPSQTWRAFLKNHMANTVSIDFFTIPTATFRILFVLIVLSHSRRKVGHFNITSNPTARWGAQQITFSNSAENLIFLESWLPPYRFLSLIGSRFGRQAKCHFGLYNMWCQFFS
jgi:hypothetical protein